METIPIAVNPDPMRSLGLVMEMGRVTAVQADSLAAAAGIRPGDRIVEPGGDPMTLPDRLAREAGKTINLKVERGKDRETVVCRVRLREPTEMAPSIYINSPLAAPALGVSYRVLNKVAGVVEGEPRRAGRAEAGRRDSSGQADFARRGGASQTEGRSDRGGLDRRPTRLVRR